MYFNNTTLSSFLKKQLLFFLSICIVSSCSNKKEGTLLKVLEAIEQDNITTIKDLCTPKAFEQIERRKSTFQSLLINNWDLDYNDLNCSEGDVFSKCSLCDPYESCTSLDYFNLRNKEGKWLVDYNEQAPIVIAEQFLQHLEKMDFDAAQKLAGPKLRKKAILRLLKDTGALSSKELQNLRQEITTIASFNPTLEWLTCRDDASYPHTKICFLCNSLYGQTDKVIRVTQMKDKKWYVEY